MTLTVGKWYNVAHCRAQGPLQFAGHRKLWGYIYLTFWDRPGAAVVFDSQQARALMNAQPLMEEYLEQIKTVEAALAELFEACVRHEVIRGKRWLMFNRDRQTYEVTYQSSYSVTIACPTIVEVDELTDDLKENGGKVISRFGLTLVATLKDYKRK